MDRNQQLESENETLKQQNQELKTENAFLREKLHDGLTLTEKAVDAMQEMRELAMQWETVAKRGTVY